MTGKNGRKRWRRRKKMALVGRKPRGAKMFEFKPRDPGPAAPAARLAA